MKNLLLFLLFSPVFGFSQVLAQDQYAFNSEKAGGFSISSKATCEQLCTNWQMFTQKNLNTSPVDVTGLPAPGVGKIIVPKFVLVFLDAGTTPFNFTDALRLVHSTQASLGGSVIMSADNMNSTTDYYCCVPFEGNPLAPNDKMQLWCFSNASLGNGRYYVKVYYTIEDAPF